MLTRKAFLTISAALMLAPLAALSQGYHNPLLPGFYPDPSVCRVDSSYYMVNSSFEYFPGVPIHHSRDLIHWEQLGHVLTRPSQFQPKGGNIWGGIYAPTIRHYDGRFYMVTTDVTGRGNFLVHATDPRGPWSEPVKLEQGGIDPSLYFEDGRCYMVSNPGDAIWLCEINPLTGATLTESRQLWRGTGGRYPEGPHIYKRHGWYYLMISEGGTEYGHMVTIARSRSIEGPYESCQRNPILTHTGRIAQTNEIQGVGHADMVEAHDGSWWLVCLAFRPKSGQHHVLGRETFLAPVEWDADGWPVVNGDGTLSLHMADVPTLPQVSVAPTNATTDFDEATLGMEWNYNGYPTLSCYSLTERPSHLRIKACDIGLSDHGSPSFVGRRQQHHQFRATTRVETNGEGRGGITVYMSPSAHYDLFVEQGQLHLRHKLGCIEADKVVCSVPAAAVSLRVEATDDIYSFGYSTDGSTYQSAGQLDMRYLSSETNGGFTGVYLGLFAEKAGYADFDGFTYEPM